MQRDRNHAAQDDSDRFRIRHVAEVEALLRGVMASKALVTLQTEDARDFLVTTIVDIDSGAGQIFLGCANDAAKNQALLGARRLSVSTFHERIRVQFSSDQLELVTLDNQPVFRVPLPTEVQRFQRREFFRLPTSLTNPIKCLIPSPQGDIETSVIDISVGGIGILAYESGISVDAGAVFHGCRLVMPDGGAFMVSLSVRSTYDVSLKNGTISHRAGCQFINLPISIESEIQRYIFRVERDRRPH